jgi:hypothetical protein
MEVDGPVQIVRGTAYRSLLKNWSATQGAQDFIGVSIWNLILEFLPGMPVRGPLTVSQALLGSRRTRTYPLANLAINPSRKRDCRLRLSSNYRS